MSKRQGFSLSKRWNKGLWSLWDSLTPSEREDYEQYYEDRDNELSKYKIPYEVRNY